MIDKFYRENYKILGGPGCGKTTKLLEILSNYFKGGLQPDQTLMIGFARATVENLRDRAVEKKLLTEKQAESIKTIHKFCLDSIGKHNILNSSAKTEFKKKFSSDPDKWFMLNDPKYDKKDDEPAMWSEQEDKKLAIYYDIVNKAHHFYGSEYCSFYRYGKFKDELDKVKTYFKESNIDAYKNVHTAQLIYFYNHLAKFKNDNGFVDFDDMLLKALKPTIEFPSYKVVLVDEVQDLSRLEWQVISKIRRKTEEIYLVGDDDQAIYGWKGSDVSIFQKWRCKKHNITKLEKTYRLPGKIYDLALKIRDEIGNRMGNEFKCEKRDNNDEGSINDISDVEELEDTIKVDSDVIFCARAKVLCRPYADFLKRKGFIFLEKHNDNKGKGFQSSFPEKIQKIINDWKILKEGGYIAGINYFEMVNFIRPEFIKNKKKTALSNKDTTMQELLSDELFTYEELTDKFYLNADKSKEWHEIFYFDTKRIVSSSKPKALFNDRADFNDYLYRCWKQNESLKTKIILSTIHGVKGREADIVVVNVDWGFSLNAYERGNKKVEDEEVRVCYVAVTRTKNDLFLLDIPHNRSKPFPLLKHHDKL